uniref:Anaphase-promoting complex subunit 4 WD40 domain-containing protein n=1 Tax=Ascaris lumbricoides TaxID=6252 RepID=A0A9J2PNZ1_ASCLU
MVNTVESYLKVAGGGKDFDIIGKEEELGVAYDTRMEGSITPKASELSWWLVSSSMTVLGEAEGDRVFLLVNKIPKAHDRAIVAVEYIRDPFTQEVSLLTCAHDSIKIWSADDVTSMRKHQEIKGWRCGVQAFDVSSDGRSMRLSTSNINALVAAVVGVDSTLHQVLIADDKTATVQSFNNGCMQIWQISIAPDRTHYLTANFSGALTLLDMNGQITKSGSFNAVKQISAVVYSPDGKSIAVANNEGVVTIVSAATLASRFFFEAHAVKVRAVCFSPDSSTLLTGSDDRTVKLHQINALKSQLVKSFCGHRSSVTSVQFDHCIDGLRFASSSNDAVIIVWDVSSGCQLHTFTDSHDGAVNGLAFSLDNQYLASVGDDRSICVHRVDNSERRPNDREDDSSTQDQHIHHEYAIPTYSAEESFVHDAHGYYSSSAHYRPDAADRSEYLPMQFDGDAEPLSRYHPAGRLTSLLLELEKNLLR